jgi:hypothetical protein
MIIEPIATPVVADTFSLLPLWQGLEPYLIAAIGAVITIVSSWLCLQIKTYMDITVNTALSERLNRSAENAAGYVISQIEGPVANLVIHIDSPMVSSGLVYLQTHIPTVIAQLNFTPQQLRELILAKLGQAQVAASATTSQAMSCPTAIKMAERSAT